MIPKGCYWDGRDRVWYTIVTLPDPDGGEPVQRRRRVADRTASTAELRLKLRRVRGDWRRRRSVADDELRMQLFLAGRLPDTEAFQIRTIRKLRCAWGDKAKIRELYKLAKHLTATTSVEHEVDHVIPICHPLVCGLHVETNLRVIVLDHNRVKSNTWSPETVSW